MDKEKLFSEQAQIKRVKDDEDVQEVYEAMVSPNVVDRDTERVDPKAYKKSIKQYLQNNPVVFYDHSWSVYGLDNQSRLPIGKAIGAKITDEGLKAKFVFSPLEFAQNVKTLVDEGFLNAVSAGFIPKNWETDKDGVRVYTEVEMLEFSVVGVPANQAAMIMNSLKEKGVNVKKIKNAYDSLVLENKEKESREKVVETKKTEMTYSQKLKLLYKGKNNG